MLTLACISCSPYHPNCKTFVRMDDTDQNECYYSDYARRIIREYENTGKIANREFIASYLLHKGNVDAVLRLLPKG